MQGLALQPTSLYLFMCKLSILSPVSFQALIYLAPHISSQPVATFTTPRNELKQTMLSGHLDVPPPTPHPVFPLTPYWSIPSHLLVARLLLCTSNLPKPWTATAGIHLSAIMWPVAKSR